MLSRYTALLFAIFTGFLASLLSVAAPSDDAINRGESFLAGLFDPELNLLPEYSGSQVFWLFHDNYLAAKVLRANHADLSEKIMNAIHKEGVRKSGKIEILFGEAENPLPFRNYKLQIVRTAGSKEIRTEVVTDRILNDWDQYADLLLFASIAEPNRSIARIHWDQAMRMWDGKGFSDAATRNNKLYATYKVALALIASRNFDLPNDTFNELRERLLSLQNGSGGWITDYNNDGKKVGLPNVETTSIAMLALGGVTPLLQAHSHNDYEHPHPFWDAYNLGFCNIEPDIHLIDGKLLVAHNLKDVTPEKTLETLYLDPILNLFERGEISMQRFPITLLIDVKSAAEPTYEVLDRTLQRYAKMLTRFEGNQTITNAVTVVVSGERARQMMQEQKRRFATYDGRLEDIDSDSPASFIWWVSDDWTKHFKWRGKGPVNQSDLEKLHSIVEKAHAHGRKVRFWAMPDTPEVWQMLKTNQVDIIGSDHLEALRAFLTNK
jgi:hypothetical protein